MTGSTATAPPTTTSDTGANSASTENAIPDMSLKDLIDGENERGLPRVQFVEDISAFADSFTPSASAELLIGAFTELHGKYKASEANLQSKQDHLKQKVPELEKSLSLIQVLQQRRKQAAADTSPNEGSVRYSLADNIFAKATVDYSIDTVNLWLGANVMLEFTYDDAIAFVQTNLGRTTSELARVVDDLAFIRDQIVTSEVNMSRVYNWDVRRKRGASKDTTTE